MPTLKLTYFDIHGGRGEPARLALHIGSVLFEDHRVAPGDWPSLKDKTPFGTLPVLEVDGVPISESNAINRYAGKLAGLYPSDPYQALLCDEAMGVVEDVSAKYGATFAIKDPEEKKAARVALAEGPLAFYLKRLQDRLAGQGGEHFADGRLTVADLKVFVLIRYLKSGTLDHVPTDLPDRMAPLLVAHYQRVKAHPKVAAYYADRDVPAR